jgi:hypothetical protein
MASVPRGARLPGAILLALLAGALSARLGSEFHRLLFEPDGPMDLILLRGLIVEWFAGIPFYEVRGGIHPPAVFLLLWPVYGWASEGTTRWVFLVAAALAGAGLVRLLLREARAVGWDRAWLAVVLVGCYPAAITIGNGQATFFILMAAFSGVLVTLRRAPGAGRDAVLTALFLVALIKPNLTLPFFWLIAFKPGWVRPAALAIAAYLLATVASVALHGASLDDIPAMIEAWYRRADYGLVSSGYGNVHAWLGALKLKAWILPASLLIFALHGLWAWRHREADVWVLIGVAGIVARLWGYHRVYDDLLLVFPLIALYRLGRGESGDRAAWALFLAGAAALVAPITPILDHASWALVGLWLLQLAYLSYRGVSVATGRISSSSDTPPWRNAP